MNTKLSSVNYSGGLPPPEFLELAEKYHPGVTKEIFDGFTGEPNMKSFSWYIKEAYGEPPQD